MNSAATSSRFNPWPYAIIAAFALFIAGTITLIVVASADRSDLVAADYYEQEIRYQGRVDQLRRTLPWESKIAVAFDPGSRSVRIALPREHAALGAQGRAELYRPSGAGEDRTVPLALDAEGRQEIPGTALATGRWRVRLHWQVGGDTFFADRDLVVTADAQP